MKAIYSFLFAIALSIFSIPYLNAQSTEGTEFWLTFGSIADIPMTPSTISSFDFRIRIVAGNITTTATIHFTSLNKDTTFTIAPYEIYTYILDNNEKPAVYTIPTGTTDYSMRTTTSHPVSVYALRQFNSICDVSNLLPVTALGTEYYAISYHDCFLEIDAYSVVAIQNNTDLHHNDTLVATLDAGGGLL